MRKNEFIKKAKELGLEDEEIAEIVKDSPIDEGYEILYDILKSEVGIRYYIDENGNPVDRGIK